MRQVHLVEVENSIVTEEQIQTGISKTKQGVLMDLIDHEQGAKDVIQECLLEGENTIEIGMEIETVFISEAKEGDKIDLRTKTNKNEERVVSEA